MRPFHRLADIFPLIEGEEFEQLVASIKENGLREAVVVHEGMILDGRNRARACEASGYEPDYTPYKGENPLAFVIDKNLRRRHLNESQRGMVAAKLATVRQGERTDLAQPSANLRKVDQNAAAAMLNVSVRTVQSANKVCAEATPELVAAVEHGQIAVSVAAQAAELPEDDQREVVKAAKAHPKNVVRLTIKEKRRRRSERKMAKKQGALAQQRTRQQQVDDAVDTLMEILGADDIALMIKLLFAHDLAFNILFALREKVADVRPDMPPLHRADFFAGRLCDVSEHSFNEGERPHTSAVAQ
jgi:ParB-like chromosome segregation protein Spo0J